MGASYGLIEVSGVVAAIDSLDAMCKASDVTLVTWERKLGGRLVTIIVEGGVSDVKAAVEAAEEICEENHHILAAHGVIAAPSEEIRRLVALSASRLQKKKEPAGKEAPKAKKQGAIKAADAKEPAAKNAEKAEEAAEGAQPEADGKKDDGTEKPAGQGRKNHRKK